MYFCKITYIPSTRSIFICSFSHQIPYPQSVSDIKSAVNQFGIMFSTHVGAELESNVHSNKNRMSIPQLDLDMIASLTKLLHNCEQASSSHNSMTEPSTNHHTSTNDNNSSPSDAHINHGSDQHRIRWTEQEHQKFLDGIILYGRKNHKQITELVATRSIQQTISHSQKFFITVNGIINQILSNNNNRLKYNKAFVPNRQHLQSSFKQMFGTEISRVVIDKSPTHVEGTVLFVQAPYEYPNLTQRQVKTVLESLIGYQDNRKIMLEYASEYLDLEPIFVEACTL
ncbi:Myb-like_DNA-binding domain-containing protein [Hexamita inflata]|uniref:Myb-like DNA-binding domain-containing protein n=1 Tax=Hexamita inflata TaxID=28002 RepID=A0AA86U0G9_9EUKA|nr:Myb-like DNA-binding domain-containing protein [Hexamita inflata]